MAKQRASPERLDDAARAGWLYYIARKTQDEIAAIMGVSRQTAQRLVSLAISERLIRVRMDHPIGRCLELAERLRTRFDLRSVEVVPSDPGSRGGTVGLGEAGADAIVQWLKSEDPIVMAIGTGRTLKAAIDHLPRIHAPQHRIVSMTGNIGPDGAAAYYNVIFSMAETVEARHFPMPLPVYVGSPEERALLHAQTLIRATLGLVAEADVALVGVGEMGEAAPLHVDGFLRADELAEVQARGAVGEICGWIYDAQGELLGDGVNARTASAPIPDRSRTQVVAIAKGPRKIAAITAAVTGGLVNGLITDEATATAVLGERG